jgi:hypothetical protein
VTKGGGRNAPADGNEKAHGGHDATNEEAHAVLDGLGRGSGGIGAS